VTGPLRVEAAGETVGEAKWKALRELELLAPSLDRGAVSFEVLSEGRRGLLGVGYEPARVAASTASSPLTAAAPSGTAAAASASGEEESEQARRLRAVLERVTAALGVHCRVEIADGAESLTANCVGDDLGRLIGRHGQTLDALQLLAAAIVHRGEDGRREVVVDAAGYRARRRRRLEEVALRSAQEAIETGAPVELEPMTAAERKVVHTALEHHAGVTTASEGAEPYRHIVVEPA
jgi:spoIIIJ-associated protein